MLLYKWDKDRRAGDDFVFVWAGGSGGRAAVRAACRARSEVL